MTLRQWRAAIEERALEEQEQACGRDVIAEEVVVFTVETTAYNPLHKHHWLLYNPTAKKQTNTDTTRVYVWPKFLLTVMPKKTKIKGGYQSEED